ncbi:MAG: GNAT family N-acetyltransferase [Verrucomicrobiales bacterium]
MIRFEHESQEGKVFVREATDSDIPALLTLNRAAYPELIQDNVIWREAHLRSHLQIFAPGQLVAEVDGAIRGAVSSLIVDLGTDPLRQHTYAGITDGGFFFNHDPEGDTLYGADVYVHPDARGMGVGAALYEGRRRLCRQLNLRRILAGGRLWNYCEVKEKMSPDEYVARVISGELKDLVLSFQLREDFHVRGILRNYLNDHRSANCASLLEWLNPDYQPEAGGARKVRVACVQYQVRKVGSFEDFAAQVEYFAETAGDYRSDFVLFPEFFTVQLLSHIDAISPREGIRKLAGYTNELIELMSGLSRKYGYHLIGGSHPILMPDGRLENQSMIFLPDGTHVAQPKLHITPSEQRYWGISGGNHLQVLQHAKARYAVQICYDVEFPEASRYLADQGVEIIFVPYCTDNRQGHLRVRLCAQARAIENQIYVVTAGIVGNLPSVPAMDIHYGQAAVFTPSDFEFARDGIQAEADSNTETLLVTDLDVSDLHRSRKNGSVTPRLDRRTDLFEFRSKLQISGDMHSPADGPLDLPDATDA